MHGASSAQAGRRQGTTGAQVGMVRQAAGKRWVDPTLTQWPENDFRIFVGNLGPEVSDTMLSNAFKRYESFTMAKVVKHTFGHKSKGYGFVSLSNIQDGARALKEMQGQYIGNRPVQIKRSMPDDRTVKDKRGRPMKRRLPGHPDGQGGRGSKQGNTSSKAPASILHR